MKNLFLASLFFAFLTPIGVVAQGANDDNSQSTIEESSQGPLIPERLYQEKTDVKYEDAKGFYLTSPVEDLRIGGFFQFDGRLFLGPDQNKSTFLIRRARLYLAGKLYDTFRFMLMPRWDNLEDPTLQYAWIETIRPSWAQIRVGLFKEPFSLEALYSDLYLNFVDRSLVVRNLSHSEDLGVMVFGKIPHTAVEYAIGFFNGRERELDNNNNKEVVGRIVYLPFDSKKTGRLSLGISMAAGRYDEDLDDTTFETEADTVFWEWADDVETHSTRIRVGADLEWIRGPFLFRTEYLYTDWGHVFSDYNYDSTFFYGHGGYAEMSYILTGEDKHHDAPVIPKHNFNGCDRWGAWEIAARYQIFYVSKAPLEKELAFGANEAHGLELGINWYLNPLVTIRLDGQRIWFNRRICIPCNDVNPDSENVITGRVQAVF